MSVWLGILIGSIAVYSWKLLGNLLPKRLLDNPRVASTANMLTIALMAALVGVQAFVTKSHIVFDARVPAALLASFLAYKKVPFLVIVASAAALAAVIRLF